MAANMGFAKMLAAMPTAKFTFASFEQENAEIVKRLRPFALRSALQMIGSLHLRPDYQGWSLRTDLLSVLAVRNCSGSKAMTCAALDWLFGDALTPTSIPMLEDPSEDVAVGNVATSRGNRRVLLGSWELPDVHTTDVVALLDRPGAPEWLLTLRDSVHALLQVSDAVVERAGLRRWQASETAGRVGALPTFDEMKRLGGHLHFSDSELTLLGIKRDALTPFVCAVDALRSDTQGFAESALDRAPLVAVDGGLLLAMPASIAVAVRLFVLRATVEQGVVGAFGGALRAVQRERMDSDVSLSGGRPCEWGVELPSRPTGIVSIDDALVEFDIDKVAHVVLIHPRIEDTVAHGIAHAAPFDPAELMPLREYVQEVKARCKANGRYRGGMTIVVGAGLGGTVPIALPDDDDNWFSHSLRIGELSWLAGLYDRDTLMNLYRVAAQEAWLRSLGCTLNNPNGTLSLIGYWRANGHRLIPSDTDFITERPGWISVGTSFNREVRQQGRVAADEHTIRLPHLDRFVDMRRIRRRSLFGTQEPVYASVNLVRSNGDLAVATEVAGHAWWFVARRDDAGGEFGFIYQLWEALGLWAVSLIPYFAERVRPRELEFSLNLDANPGASAITVSDGNNSVFVVTFGLAALQALLNRAANDGERVLLEAITERAAEALGASLDTKRVVAEVLGGPDRRRIHVFVGHRDVDGLDALPSRAPRVVPDAERAMWSVRVGIEQGLTPGVVDGKDPAHQLVSKYTRACGDTILGRLGAMNRGTVVNRCMSNIEDSLRERATWRRTSRAVLALHPDGAMHANQRDAARAGADIGARTLIEMAVCAAPADSGRAMSRTDFDELIALVDLMISHAFVSDALHEDLVRPSVRVLPSGALDGDRSFIDDVVRQYRSLNFGSQFQASARAYESHFQAQPEERSDLPDGLRAAFAAEYGLEIEAFAECAHALCMEAIRRRSAVVTLSSAEFEAVLADAGRPPSDAAAVRARFALEHRPKWNAPPQGFRSMDWMPWRARRRLSLIYRPLVVVDAQGTVAYGARSVEQTGVHLVGSLVEGGLPPEFFTSAAMKSYVGGVVSRLGEQFNVDVAEQMKHLGFQARPNVNMTELGATKELGDVDVLAWNSAGTVWVIECKRLQNAVTIGDIAGQLKRFRGASDDQLDKHMRRFRWLSENASGIARVVRQDASALSLRQLLVTSAIVPLQLVSTLPVGSPQVVEIANLHNFVGPK